MKPVAVIILNWNGAALLRRYLPSVIANTNSTIADVIVADNGSTDESVKVLKEEFPEVKTLLFSENWGFAEGYNKCVAQTAYKYTVLLNSDEKSSKTLKILALSIENSKEISRSARLTGCEAFANSLITRMRLEVGLIPFSAKTLFISSFPIF